MAGRRVHIIRSIAGTALVGCGLLMMYQRLGGQLAWFRHMINACSAMDVPGLPAGIFGAAEVLQNQAANHLLRAFFEQMLVSSWPALLIMIGSMMSRDFMAGDCEKNNYTFKSRVESEVPGSTYS